MKLRVSTILFLAFFALGSRPATAAQGRLSATRSPAGLVLAGSTVTISATVENADTAGSELQNFRLNSPFGITPNPYLTLLSGTVTSRWREQDIPFGTILSGNGPGDTNVAVQYDFLPAGHHVDVSWQIRVASRLPAGVEEDLAQLFLLYDAMSIPWYLQIPIAAQPTLELSKTDLGRTLTPGGSVTYNIVARNTGSQDATGLVLTDAVPLETRFTSADSHADWSCTPNDGPESLCTLTFDSLGVGETRAFAYTLTFPSNSVPAGLETIRNVARIRDDGTNTTGSTTPRTAIATESTEVIAAPDLALSKDDAGVTAQPGASVAYQLSYRNVGTQDATGVLLEETVPEHATFDAGASTDGWTCTPSTGPAGATCSISAGDLPVSSAGSAVFAVRVDSTLPTGVDTLSNTATVHDDGAGGPDLNPSDNAATELTPLRANPDLALAKTDSDATVRPGDTLQYSLRYQNNGDQGATGVLLRETVPDHTRFVADASDSRWSCSPDASAGSSCTLPIGSLAAGARGTVRFAVALLPALPPAVEQLINTATISDDGSNGTDPNPGDNSAIEPTPVDAAPDLAVTKDDAGVTARPGDTILYTLDYQNLGDQGATMVSLEETVPQHGTFDPGSSDTGWSCQPASGAAGASCLLALGELAAGRRGSTRFAVRVETTIPAGVERLENTVLILDDGTNGDEPNPLNNTATELTPLDAAPRLVLSKSDAGLTVQPGDTLRYILSWANEGTQAASGVVLEETVPDFTRFAAAASDARWVCDSAETSCRLTLGNVAAGTSGSAAFGVVVDDTFPAGVEELLNRAVIRDDDGPNPDDLAEEPTPVDAAPRLVLSKSDAGLTVRPGDTLRYTLTWANEGTQAAASVVLEETVPAFTRFAPAASDAGWSCDSTGIRCRLALGEVAAGASGSATFGVVVDDTFPAGVEQLLNRAAIHDDDGPDPDDLAEEPTPVDAAPALAIRKTDGDVTARPGETILYTLAWRNDGTQAATGVLLEETVPTFTRFAPTSSDPAWTCDPATGPPGAVCRLSLGQVLAGGSGSASFAVVLDPLLPAGVEEVLNRAVIRDDDGPDPDDQTTEPTPVDAAPGLLVTKSDDGVVAHPGDTVVYTLRWQNQGSQAATGVALEETVPGLTRFVPGSSDPAWTCDPAAGPAGATCRLLVDQVPAGASGSSLFAVALDPLLPAGVEEILNRAVIRDDDGPDPDGQTAEPTPVDAAPDLAIKKDDAGITARPGETIVYTLSYDNRGQQAATGATLRETLPLHTTFDPSTSTAGWSCVAGPSPDAVSCTLAVGTVEAGASGTARFAVRLDADLSSSVTLVRNVAQISDDGTQGPDRDPTNNMAAEDTPVVADTPRPPLEAFLRDQLSEDRDASGSVSEGDLLTYSVRIHNATDRPAAELLWELPIPQHTTFVPGSVFGDTVLDASVSGDTLLVRLDDLPGTATTAFVLDVLVDPLPKDLAHLVAQGTITARALSPAPSDDPDTPSPNDPTLTPLATTPGAGGPVDIPTASVFGLLALALLLLSAAWLALR